MSKYATRLSRDTKYVRPETTLQDSLTEEKIREYLKDYVQTNDINNIPLDTHLRYFSLINGEQKFRMGGFLKNKNNADTYVVLSNGSNSWSVNVKDTQFFRKLSQKEIIDNVREEYDEEIHVRDQEIKELLIEIKELKHKLKANEKKMKK